MDPPKLGQIVEHYFLWADEHAAGRVEGSKPRPCIIVSVEERANAAPRVTVLPITSQPPRSETTAIAIPPELNARIGLDTARAAWIVIDDANRFGWPGFDLVPQSHGGYVMGQMTRGLFEKIRAAIVAACRSPRVIGRD